MKIPTAPRGSQTAGKRLWESVQAAYVLDERETVLLTEACRTVDLCVELHAAVRRDGVLVDGPQGLRAHPAVVEARQQRVTLARLLAALRLPEDATGTAGHRPQKRGVRGVYGIKGGAAS